MNADDLARRNDAIVSICLWFSVSLVVGATMWPVSKEPLNCYLRSTDLDLIGIGGVAAGFSWLLRLQERKRVLSIVAILVVLGAADYFHLGGADLVGLGEALLVMLIPLFIYVWLFDPSPIFDVVAQGTPTVSIVGIRRMVRELGLSEFFLSPLGGALALLLLSLALVVAVPSIFENSGLVWQGACKAMQP